MLRSTAVSLHNQRQRGTGQQEFAQLSRDVAFAARKVITAMDQILTPAALSMLVRRLRLFVAGFWMQFAHEGRPYTRHLSFRKAPSLLVCPPPRPLPCL